MNDEIKQILDDWNQANVNRSRVISDREANMFLGPITLEDHLALAQADIASLRSTMTQLLNCLS
jgi:hypothetical protein